MEPPSGANDPGLAALAAEIQRAGEAVRQLKAAADPPAAPEAVAAAVARLLELKADYAQRNGGVGVDGRPTAGDAAKEKPKGKAKEAPAPDSVNAQKKAAKKAAKKAKQDASKAVSTAIDGSQAGAGIGSGGAGAVGGKAKTRNAATAVPAAAAAPPAAVSVAAAVSAAARAPLEALQLAINPNVPLAERPVVALAVACLSDTVLDLRLVADHRRPAAALGLETGGTVLVGDLAMARYLARRAETAAADRRGRGCLAGGGPSAALSLLSAATPPSVAGAALVDMWVDYAQSLARLEEADRRLRALAMTVECALGGGPPSSSSSPPPQQPQTTYLTGPALTLADLAVFAAAGFPTQAPDLARLRRELPSWAVATRRWLALLAAHPALQEATQLCLGVAGGVEAALDDRGTDGALDPLVAGMSPLEGALAGRVMTRFPPEPSGYLHIGHSKAVLLNDYYARRYRGRLLLRFDDTNPSKEKAEFEESIVVDLAMLGVKPDLVSYTSDYFPVIEGYARQLIRSGLAYMDDTPQEQMKIERGERIESRHRNQTPEEADRLFDLMCSGSSDGSAWCLRAKIDMASDNGTMRDPVLYRQNLTPHHRSGTKFSAYPTYDLACPIVDSVEGVSHALRTTEYNDRDEQYHWIQTALGLRRVRIHAFSRVNFVNTVLSKRKLTWFVEQGLVSGWDDPRFPTVRGVIRRGLDIRALRAFMLSQGASRRVVNMDWTVFWSENRKEIDKSARRFMAVDKESNVPLTITNGPKESDYAFIETSCHPKDPALGNRVVRLSNHVLLETADVQGLELGELIVLLRWGVFKVTKIDGGLEAEFVPDGDVKTAKRKLSWIAAVSDAVPVKLYEFDNLVSKDRLDEDDNFEDHVNPHTLAVTDILGDTGLKTLRENELIQLERRGYYRVDRPYINKDKPLMLFTIPDGKSKAMSGQAGKLAHR